MRVKTYRGDSSASVLKRIKAELGGEAVILSTRNFKENGAKVCEVTAALEDASVQPSAKKPTQDAVTDCGTQAGPRAACRTADAPIPRSRAAAQAAVQPLDASTAAAMQEEIIATVPQGNGMAGMGSWQQEWAKIREHLLTTLKPQLKLDSLSPRQRQAIEYLEKEDVEDAVLMDLAAVLHGRPELSVLAPLAQIAPVAPMDFANPGARFMALAGPHGVGKTSAAIRMALQARTADPTGRICLLNADVQRSQGRLLLRQYAELADIDYRELSPGQEIPALLEECAHNTLVVVDLPALARGETMEQLRMRLGLDVLEDAGGLHKLLTLSPHFATSQLRQFGRSYLCENMSGLLWTKLDEAYTFGNLVNTAHALGLPAVAFSAGPGLQDDLVPATHNALWGLVFKHRLPASNAGAGVL